MYLYTKCIYHIPLPTIPVRKLVKMFYMYVFIIIWSEESNTGQKVSDCLDKCLAIIATNNIAL